ncbi:hypothetical protein HK097_006417 [Rhizophlyctis rosea]|uniref:DnaJ homologue subfamily C member 28 conserved domain-containing protein n=1 Tax=Rhizophlyctis rosea TaxID=64517 RepID=A0AAD5X8U3_9FUNG|nr:hypothetical protein HK097_006417 [Rhizophlyctis rosea]
MAYVSDMNILVGGCLLSGWWMYQVFSNYISAAAGVVPVRPDAKRDSLSKSEEPNKSPPPPIIDVTFSTNDTTTKTVPIDVPEKKDFYTADMNPNILNQLYGQAIKVANVAAAFTSSAFEKNPQSGALNVGQKSGEEEKATAMGKLKTFFLQHHQHTRAGAADNPTTANAVVPMVQRQFLSGSGGPPARAKKAQMLRVVHARQDAEMYKQPVEQLWTDYFAVRPTTMSGFQSIVEERIAYARRQGQFDNIRGRGKPIDFETDEHKNPFITPTEFFVHRMTKAQGFVPPWVELGKDIEDETEKVRSELRRMWGEFRRMKGWVQDGKMNDAEREEREHRGFRLGKGRAFFEMLFKGPQNSGVGKKEEIKLPKGFENTSWDQFAREWAELRIKEINEMIRKFNIEAPPGIPQKMRLGITSELDKARSEQRVAENIV